MSDKCLIWDLLWDLIYESENMSENMYVMQINVWYEICKYVYCVWYMPDLSDIGSIIFNVLGQNSNL